MYDCMYICMYVCSVCILCVYYVYVHMYVCMYVCIYYVRMYLYNIICMYVCMTCTYVFIFFLSGHCQFDPLFPWISFLGEPWQETVTSEGQLLYWDDIGITLDIPPGAVPKDKQLNLTVRPCLSGPFILPEGYKLASPVYLITPAFNFSRDGKLTITHFANVKSETDCKNMTFVSAHCTPHYTASGPQYKFKALPGGVFLTEKREASLSLKHFCVIGMANLSSEQATESIQESTGKLYT